MSSIASTTSSLQLPATIRSYIAGFDALRRRREFWRALGLAACFSTVWMLASCLADRLLKLNSDTRLTLLVIHVIVLLVLLARPVWRLVSRRIDWMEAAGDIESRDKPLGGRLQTVTSQSMEQVAEYRGSTEIIEQLASEVSQRLRSVRPERLVSRRPVIRIWLMTAFGLLIASSLARVPTFDLPTLAMRYVMPTAKIAPVTTTRLAVTPGDTQVVEGDAFQVSVRPQRLEANRPVTLYVRRGENWGATTMSRSKSEPNVLRATIPAVDQELRYYLTGGDATSPVYNVRLLRRPTVQQFLAYCEYPASTRKNPDTVTIANNSLEVPAGTRVTLSAISSEALSSAQLRRDGDSTVTEMTPGDHPEVRQTTFDVGADAQFLVDVTSRLGTRSTKPARLSVRAIPDQKPTIRLVGITGELRLHPRDILTLPYEANDDWGLQSVRLRIEVDPSQAVEPGTLTNVARGKPTMQSSTMYNADASRAVDGNSNGNFPDGSVTHTEHAAGNFWQVDLGEVTPISVVEIWNRTDAAPERLRDFDVIVSDEPIVAAAPGAAPATQPGVERLSVAGICGLPTVVDVYRAARFVRIELPRLDYLSLAEVRVYDAKPPATEWRGTISDYDDLFSDEDASDMAGKPPAIVEREIPLGEILNRRDGQLQLDLAELNLRLGDVVTVSLRTTDTARQMVSSESSRILVSPRSVDLDTYRRIRELEGASQALSITAAEFAAASAALAPTPAAQPPVAPRLALAHQHLTGAAEAGRSAVTSLLRAIARNMSPGAATSTASLIDGVEIVASDAVATSEFLSISGTGSVAESLVQMQKTGAQLQALSQELSVLLEGEKSAALLAEIQNLAASQRVPPQATREAADRARERLAQMEQDIAAGARELSLDRAVGSDLQGQLKQKVDAAAGLAATRAMINFATSATPWVERLKQPALSRVAVGANALTARLDVASHAEALRKDSDATRARDLGLASLAVQRLTAIAQAPAAPVPATAQAIPTPEILPPLLAALHLEHDLNRRASTQPVLDAEAAPIRAAAADARQKLLALIDLPASSANATAQGAAPSRSAETDAALARRLDEELALRASTLAAAGDYEAAAEIDRQLSSRAASVPDRKAASNNVSRLNAVARRLEQLADAQNLLARQADRATTMPTDSNIQQTDLAERQRLLSQAIRAAASSETEQSASNDSRRKADHAVRSARQKLASLPGALSSVQVAAADRRAARERAAAARQVADAAGLEQWAAANRVAVAAELERQGAEARYEQASSAVDVDVADAIGDSLRPFAPETVEAVRIVDEQLTPALAGLKQASAGADPTAVDRAAAEALAGSEKASSALKTVHASLLADDPMLAARSAASAATEALARPAPTASEAAKQLAEVAALQRESVSALTRAAQRSNHQAALERLGTLPSIAPLLAASPPAGAALRTPVVAIPEPQVAPRSLFQALRDWGQLSWRIPGDVSVAATEADPPGYRDALDAYFLAIHNADLKDAAPTAQEAK